jgi:hypothetical protein
MRKWLHAVKKSIPIAPLLHFLELLRPPISCGRWKQQADHLVRIAARMRVQLPTRDFKSIRSEGFTPANQGLTDTIDQGAFDIKDNESFRLQGALR